MNKVEKTMKIKFYANLRYAFLKIEYCWRFWLQKWFSAKTNSFWI